MADRLRCAGQVQVELHPCGQRLAVGGDAQCLHVIGGAHGAAIVFVVGAAVDTHHFVPAHQRLGAERQDKWVAFGVVLACAGAAALGVVLVRCFAWVSWRGGLGAPLSAWRKRFDGTHPEPYRSYVRTDQVQIIWRLVARAVCMQRSAAAWRP